MSCTLRLPGHRARFRACVISPEWNGEASNGGNYIRPAGAVAEFSRPISSTLRSLPRPVMLGALFPRYPGPGKTCRPPGLPKQGDKSPKIISEFVYHYSIYFASKKERDTRHSRWQAERALSPGGCIQRAWLLLTPSPRRAGAEWRRVRRR